MAVEIERKFLVKESEWQKARKKARKEHLYQGYLCRDVGRTVRIRIAGNAASLTVKGPSTGAARTEFEYKIPKNDAQIMLQYVYGALIEKYRYTLLYDDFVWEVDEFLGENIGLLVAEVELEREDQPLALPPWVEREVTGDPRYYNSNLTIAPYCGWPKGHKNNPDGSLS